MAKYTHRNGEGELPTIEGWYWFKGRVDDRDEAGLAKVHKPNNAFPTLIVSPQWVDGWMDADSFVGQWWGPVTPPWEEQPAPTPEAVQEVADSLLAEMKSHVPRMAREIAAEIAQEQPNG